MKGIGFALLCIVAAVQSRNLDVDGLSSTPARLGENPWIVHLRVASASGGGFLHTCVGSLIDTSWVLTAATCVNDARFIWLRYGAVDPIRPELVTESTVVRLNPDFDAETGENNIALVGINRVVQSTANIRPISLAAADAAVPSAGRVCGFGGENNVPGEQLACFENDLDVNDDGTIAVQGQTTEFDFGGPLVSDGVQVGVLTGIKYDVSVFVRTGHYVQWIKETTGI